MFQEYIDSILELDHPSSDTAAVYRAVINAHVVCCKHAMAFDTSVAVAWAESILLTQEASSWPVVAAIDGILLVLCDS